MPEPVQTPRDVRFGSYKLDLSSGELHKNGSRIRLPEQPFQILQLLLRRPGEVVTREELRQRLWSGDTFVDFENGLNGAVKKLRDVLGDSAEKPRFVETIPRRGYRFIAPVETLAAEARARVAWWRTPSTAGLLALAALLVFAVAFNFGGLRNRIVAASVGRIESVAVLPARNLTGDPEKEVLADAATDVLTTHLEQIKSLTVPSTTSAMVFKGQRKRVPEIARELNVQAVVELSVLPAGQQVQINVQLIHGPSDRHLWANLYDCDPRNMQATLSGIARDLIGAMNIAATPEEKTRVSGARQTSPEAYAAYAKGGFHFRRGTEQDRAKAFQYFQQAARLDPNYAPAYAWMALLDAHGGSYRLAEGGAEFRAHARQLAQKALELDETLAEAHVALAWLEFWDWDFASADREFRRAIELNPNLSIARIWYISYLACMLRTEEADAQSEVALRLDPASYDVLSHVALSYLFSHRADKAIKLLQKAIDLEPNYHPAHWALGKAYYVNGMYPESVAEFDKAIALDERERSTAALALLAPAYIRAGRRKEGLEILREFEGRVKRAAAAKAKVGGGGLQAAFAYISLGDKDKAFEHLEKSYNNRGMLVGTLLVEPLFEPLHSDPRFHDLARRIGFPPDTLRRAGISPEDLAAPQPAPAQTASHSGKNIGGATKR